MFTEKPSKHSLVNLLIKKKMFLTEQIVYTSQMPLYPFKSFFYYQHLALMYGTFVMINELILTYYYSLKSIVHIRVPSWCCTFYGI